MHAYYIGWPSSIMLTCMYTCVFTPEGQGYINCCHACKMCDFKYHLVLSQGSRTFQNDSWVLAACIEALSVDHGTLF